MTFADFKTVIESLPGLYLEDLKEESNKWYDEVIEFVLKNKIYFILVMVLIGASFGIYIYRKTKRQKELGL